MTAGLNTRLKTLDTWVFDLDNTIYPSSSNLFPQIHQKMGQFIANMLSIPVEEARKIQEDYYHRYGTSLNGLMAEHNMLPDKFLDFVHDLDYRILKADPKLRSLLSALDATLYIFTNGTVKHAEAVLNQMGIADLFADIFDINIANYIHKPNAAPYDAMVAKANITPHTAIMVEDIAKNLRVPAKIGMTTLWVKNPFEAVDPDDNLAYIHYQTDNLLDWLGTNIP